MTITHPMQFTEAARAYFDTLKPEAQSALLKMGRVTIAHHEAGHAMMGRFFKIGVKSVVLHSPPQVIQPTAGGKMQFCNGQVNYYTRGGGMIEGPTSELLSVLYAGYIAEGILHHETRTIRGGDAELARALLKDLGCPAWQRVELRKQARERTYKVLYDPRGWRGVVNIAEHLLKHGRIDGTRELDRIIEQDWIRKDGRKTRKR